MKNYQKHTGRAKSIPAGLGTGALLSIIITIAASVLLSNLLNRGILQWENIGYGIMITLATASISGALIACSQIKQQRLMVSALSGIIYLLLLLSGTALFFGGQYEGVAVSACLIMGTSIAAGLFGLREQRGKRTGKSRKVHR